MALQQEAGRANTGPAFLLYRKDHVTLKCESYDSYRAKSSLQNWVFFPVSECSGRIREKAGNQGQWLEEKPKKKRTNQRKSRKSGASTERKAGGEADEPEKKQEIVSIGQKKTRRKSGRTGEKAGNQGH